MLYISILLSCVKMSKSFIDIDECADPRKNNCEHLCVNTNGDYNCTCREGYERTGKFDCESTYHHALRLCNMYLYMQLNTWDTKLN